MAERALVAMSGGVDSSMAALLMREKGYEVRGVTMVLFPREDAGGDPDGPDAADARAVCRSLGIPHETWHLEDEFREHVIEPFVRAYEEGLTPNPCVLCNRTMKFGLLYERGRRAGADVVATGHYARVERDGGTGRMLLRKAADLSKDQSYVLYGLTQEELAHVAFPLGGMTKAEVRARAAKAGLRTAGRPESQDICFVPDGDYAAFIRTFTGKEYPEGDFVDQDGRVLGRHKGLIRYTRGQGRHLGLSLPHRMYVVRRDLARNEVVLGENADLFTRTLVAGGMNWIAWRGPSDGRRVKARVRYSQKEADAAVEPLEDGRVRIVFDEPQRAITPGQAVVLYDGDYVAGGGTILSV